MKQSLLDRALKRLSSCNAQRENGKCKCWEHLFCPLQKSNISWCHHNDSISAKSHRQNNKDIFKKTVSLTTPLKSKEPNKEVSWGLPLLSKSHHHHAVFSFLIQGNPFQRKQKERLIKQNWKINHFVLHYVKSSTCFISILLNDSQCMVCYVCLIESHKNKDITLLYKSKLLVVSSFCCFGLVLGGAGEPT